MTTQTTTVTVFANEMHYNEVASSMYKMYVNSNFTIEQTEFNAWSVTCEGMTEAELICELEHDLLELYNLHIEGFFIA